MKGQAPQGILDPILKEAAALAEVALDQLVIVRAESVVWNDGSLGCPEPGMMYTQALVNGYWVVIEAAGRWINSRCASDRCDYVNPAFRARPTSLGARALRAHGTLAEKQRRYASSLLILSPGLRSYAPIARSHLSQAPREFEDVFANGISFSGCGVA